MEQCSNMKALIIIANAGYAENVVETARKAGVRGATVINSRGGGDKHELFMGITLDSEKEMILCIVDKDVAEKAMSAIKENVGIKTPAHGICFTLPVENMVGVDNNMHYPQ